MKQALVLLFIIAILSLNFSHKNNIPGVAANLIIKSDTDHASYLKNKIWAIRHNVNLGDDIKYMYIDSSLNLFLLSKFDDSLNKPFVFSEKLPEKTIYVSPKYEKTITYVFIQGRRESMHLEIDLTTLLTGKIIFCTGKAVCSPPIHCKTSSVDFSVTELGITCCINHYPARHCCKTLKEMADTTKIYKCIWQ